MPKTADFVYGGDVAKWKKFANSLRLRLAMRLTKVDINKAKSEAEAAIAGGFNDDTKAALRRELNTYFNDDEAAAFKLPIVMTLVLRAMARLAS